MNCFAYQESAFFEKLIESAILSVCKAFSLEKTHSTYLHSCHEA